MNRKQTAQDRHQGMFIIALAIISQARLGDFPDESSNQPGEEQSEKPQTEDFPDEGSNRPEEELPENKPDGEPEMPDQDNLGFDEEIGIAGENAFPEIREKEMDEEANDAVGVPVHPPTPPSDLNETTI